MNMTIGEIWDEGEVSKNDLHMLLVHLENSAKELDEIIRNIV
jgi:hypothetical protein